MNVHLQDTQHKQNIPIKENGNDPCSYQYTFPSLLPMNILQMNYYKAISHFHQQSDSNHLGSSHLMPIQSVAFADHKDIPLLMGDQYVSNNDITKFNLAKRFPLKHIHILSKYSPECLPDQPTKSSEVSEQ